MYILNVPAKTTLCHASQYIELSTTVLLRRAYHYRCLLFTGFDVGKHSEGSVTRLSSQITTEDTAYQCARNTFVMRAYTTATPCPGVTSQQIVARKLTSHMLCYLRGRFWAYK